jgi:hypothetical protein
MDNIDNQYIRIMSQDYLLGTETHDSNYKLKHITKAHLLYIDPQSIHINLSI